MGDKLPATAPHRPSSGGFRPEHETDAGESERRIGGADTPVETAASTATDTILLRVLALGALVVLMDLWLEQHGTISASHPGFLVTVFSALALGSKVLDRLLEKAEQNRLEAVVRGSLRVAVSNQVLFVAWGAALALMLTRSSVEVVPELPGDRGSATIGVGPDSQTLSVGPDLKPARFPMVSTNPFGRRYTVSAPGYVTGSFMVYPVAGLHVTLGRELLPSPSALFRPDVEVLSYLKSDGAWLKISIRRGDKLDSIAGSRSPKSALLGRAQQVPADMLQDWQLELAPNTPAAAAEAMLAWKHPVPLTSATALAPGSALVAEVFSQGRKCVGRADVVLHTEKLVDVEITRGCEP
jgi:hypothetical protein